MADPENEISDCKSVKDIRINRGIDFEVEINEVDLEDVADCNVFDEFGTEVRFGDLYKHRKTIVIFIRHFLCYTAKEYVEDLAQVRSEALENADVQLVVIGCAPWKFIPVFKRVTGFTQYALYCDPDRHIYKKLQLREKNLSFDSGCRKESKHVKSGIISGIMKSVWRAKDHPMEFQGDVRQNGGAFVIGPGDEVHFTHYDRDAFDHAAINTVLQAAGLPMMSFPKDPRILHL
ncbi:peroxiredoxin-like 2C [Tubulanus polymorphus]|uniref:peroxiredoxin-like 2C n=1 Tax=Tubulanus polymorphus TaxID=672921 RepID=UPI003DA4D91A